LQEKTQKDQNSWAQKEKNLQYAATQLQEKYQKGLITTADAQKQQADIEKKVANYQTNVQKEAQTLDEENLVFSNRSQDLIMRSIQAVNADKKYKMVVNATALLDAAEALDISDAVLAKMNELYAADKAAEATASKE
jgi:outer membrane protein